MRVRSRGMMQLLREIEKIAKSGESRKYELSRSVVSDVVARRNSMNDSICRATGMPRGVDDMKFDRLNGADRRRRCRVGRCGVSHSSGFAFHIHITYKQGSLQGTVMIGTCTLAPK